MIHWVSTCRDRSLTRALGPCVEPVFSLIHACVVPHARDASVLEVRDRGPCTEAPDIGGLLVFYLPSVLSRGDGMCVCTICCIVEFVRLGIYRDSVRRDACERR